MYGNVEGLKEHLDMLSRCCLEEDIKECDPIAVICAADDPDSGQCLSERSGFYVFENADGRFGVLEDSEDSTGHG